MTPPPPAPAAARRTRPAPARYASIWAACIRYSVTRQLMFRGDFFVWLVTGMVWLGVNLILIEVVYGHVDSLAGWNKHEMLLLMGTSLLLNHTFLALFLTNFYEFGRAVRMGSFDFTLAQPGQVLFMVSTRKLELDSAVNVFLCLGIVIHAAGQLGLAPSLGEVAAYVVLCLCGLAIHYSVMTLLASLVFWLVKSEGVENGYFSLFEFSRLPREAYRGLAQTIFVWALPVVVVAAVPAEVLRRGVEWGDVAWLVGVAAGWFAVAVWVFHRGLRRYASASS